LAKEKFDLAIIGGGLAALALAIQSASNGQKVLLIEKGDYPRHKVCGEYISMESYDFLVRLGLDLDSLALPRIHQLKLSDQKGYAINQALTLGGFGISRYLLEDLMYKRCLAVGVKVLLNTECTSAVRRDISFELQTSQGVFNATICCAAFGKYAPQNFYKPKRLEKNWVGVKYHISYDHEVDVVALHNFYGGYCGMSKIEDDKSCLCYLVDSLELKKAGSIERLEKEVLMQNSHLEKVFKQAKFLFTKPQVISNVTFSKKKAVDASIFYIGDAAGTIAPLSGNGMSNALRSSNILALILQSYYGGEITFEDSLTLYERQWDRAFSARIGRGRILQNFFCKAWLTQSSIRIMKWLPFLQTKIIKSTHGEVF